MAKTKKKENEIKNHQAEIERLTNSLKRALADYQNLEKRVVEEKQQFAKYAKGSLIKKILPVLDSLFKVEEQINNQGLSLSLRQLRLILKEEGLEEIEVQGKDFDPYTMEAVEVDHQTTHKKVVKVFERGYKLYDKVLRVAKVKVK